MDLDRLLVITGALLAWLTRFFLMRLAVLESKCCGATCMTGQLLLSTSVDLNVVPRLLSIEVVVHDDAILLLKMHIPTRRRGDD